MADSRGNIWIGTGAGICLNKYDGISFARYTTAQGLASTAINQIIEDRQGNIWFAGREGVDKYDGKYITNYGTENGLIHKWVFCLLEDKKGNLWLGTEIGLSKFDGKFFINYSIEQGLKGQAINALLEDHHGNIWIGTTSKGVYSFDGTSFTHYDPKYSVSHPIILGMLEDKNNNIWLCTGRGLNKFDGKFFTWYTTEQGLSNNIVKNVLEDKNGNIWIGTINFASDAECNSPAQGATFAVRMTGELEGCLYVFVDEYACSPSGTYREMGREYFFGTYNGGSGLSGQRTNSKRNTRVAPSTARIWVLKSLDVANILL